MEKYESMLNLNAEIRIQKPELAFRDEHLVNFLLASMPSTYEGIIDNLNMRDVLSLERKVRAFRTKETELTDLGLSRRREHTLLPEEGSVEVEEAEEELGRAQFLEPPMGVMQF